MSATALVTLDQPEAALAPDEQLTASQWCLLLGIKPQPFRREMKAFASVQGVGTRLQQFFPFSKLPVRWQTQLLKQREDRHARCFRDLLTGPAWAAPKKMAETTGYNEAKAQRVWQVIDLYETLQGQGMMEKVAVVKAVQRWEMIAKFEWRNSLDWHPSFPDLDPKISEKTVRRWSKRVTEAGGHGVAPLEAYGHFLSCQHKAAQADVKLMKRLGIDEEAMRELVGRVRELAASVEHASSVYHGLQIEWQNNREVPGLGVRKGMAPFPLTEDQVRAMLPSTPSRRLGSHGEARAARECLPWIHRDVSTLRPGELLVLDDTRINLICTHDVHPQRLLELKAYILMDVATRRIVAFTIKDGPIGKEDVSALLARYFRGIGLPGHYTTHILFERGAVACSDAAETILRSLWPGRVEVHRTSMDGGKKSAVAAFWESGSGHWMGKGWIESFMRTIAIMCEAMPGQRGSKYELQPAHLGLTGRDHGTNALRYNKNPLAIKSGGATTRLHEAAITGIAEAAMQWLDGTPGDPRRRLSYQPLLPKSMVIQRVAEVVAYYNSTNEHRRDGLKLIKIKNALGHWVDARESSDEAWHRLGAVAGFERVAPQDAARLLKWRGATATVDGGNGVILSVSPWKGLRFWKPDSLACHEANHRVGLTIKVVALYDVEAFRTYRPGIDAPLEIHIMGAEGSAEKWKPGDPARYIETLPLAELPAWDDAQALAMAKADKQRAVNRIKIELGQALGPRAARDLEALTKDEDELRGVVIRMEEHAGQMAESQIGRDMQEGTGSRLEQRAAAQAALSDAERQAARDILDERD